MPASKEKDASLSQEKDPKFLCGVAVSVYQNSGPTSFSSILASHDFYGST